MLNGCHHDVGEATTKFELYTTPSSAEEFHSLFAAEPICHGLSLAKSAVIRLHYYGDAGRTQFGGYIIYPNVNADLDFSGDNPGTGD
jgi:hypothetical protein